ncbi:outer membrane porin, OprD family [Sesbania bispinosa]|nr:outer membrane porin, OprD family [Sesbania bispinosa]
MGTRHPRQREVVPETSPSHGVCYIITSALSPGKTQMDETCSNGENVSNNELNFSNKMFLPAGFYKGKVRFKHHSLKVKIVS